MININKVSRYRTHCITPEVFNVDNPVQAEGAARGRRWHTAFHNPVGVEFSY